MNKTILKVTKSMSLLNPPAYNKGVVNDRYIFESGKKYEPPEPPAYSTCAVND
jgi:hypothetical protein